MLRAKFGKRSDGFSKISEYAERSKEINQKFLCITDHGVMGAVPEQIAESQKHDLISLYGIELYVNPMQPCVDFREQSAEFRKNLGDGSKILTPEQKKFDKSHHLLAIACNNIGYSNLVKLSSWAWIHGYYRRPRVNHEVLQKYKEGIIFTSCCGISEIANAFMGDKDANGNPIFNDEAGFRMVEKYMAMFGKNFYLELMMLDWKMQKPYDRFLLKAHEKYGIPIEVSTDTHYCLKEHSRNQRLMLMQQNKRTLSEVQAMIDSGESDELFELQDENLWQKSEEEMDEKWEKDYHDVIPYELYQQAKRNTVKICELAKGVSLDRSVKLPMMPDAEDVLMDQIQQGFRRRRCPDTPEYQKRIREEYDLICEKGFASYFLIQKMMTDEARVKGPSILGFGDGSEVVGPGRGCLHPKTPIRLANGLTKPIEEMMVDEYVVTIDGLPRPVKKVMCYDVVNEPLMRIKTHFGDNTGVALTFDHKVYAKKKTERLKWYRADELEVGDWCFVPFSICFRRENCSISLYNKINSECIFATLEEAETYRGGVFFEGFPASLEKTPQGKYAVKGDAGSPHFKRSSSGFLLQIKEITEEIGIDKVWDLEIAGKHNYLTSSFLVHNSVCGSLVAYCLRLHDVEPIIHDLRFSRFLSPARGGKQMCIRHNLQPIPHQKVEF